MGGMRYFQGVMKHNEILKVANTAADAIAVIRPDLRHLKEYLLNRLIVLQVRLILDFMIEENAVKVVQADYNEACLETGRIIQLRYLFDH